MFWTQNFPCTRFKPVRLRAHTSQPCCTIWIECQNKLSQTASCRRAIEWMEWTQSREFSRKFCERSEQNFNRETRLWFVRNEQIMMWMKWTSKLQAARFAAAAAIEWVKRTQVRERFIALVEWVKRMKTKSEIARALRFSIRGTRMKIATEMKGMGDI